MIAIDKGIDLPDVGYKGAPLPNYPKASEFPWARMSIGDSFFIPVDHGNDLIRLMNRITGSGAARMGPGCVSARTVIEGGKIGVRAWLVNKPER